MKTNITDLIDATNVLSFDDFNLIFTELIDPDRDITSKEYYDVYMTFIEADICPKDAWCVTVNLCRK